MRLHTLFVLLQFTFAVAIGPENLKVRLATELANRGKFVYMYVTLKLRAKDLACIGTVSLAFSGLLH